MMKSNLGLDRSRKGVGGDEPEHAGERLLRMPEVVLLLSVEPEVRCRAGKTGEAGGHLRTDRRRAGQNPVERLTRDAKLAGRLADGETKARQNPVPQDPAWMGRRRREDVSGGGHALTSVKPTEALWVTDRRRQGLP